MSCRIIRLFVFITMLFVNATDAALAETPRLLVLYPTTEPSFGAIFDEILGGIESSSQADIKVRTVTQTTRRDDLVAIIAQQKIDAVIALGQSTYSLAHSLRAQLPVIHGGLFLSPGDHSGITLAGSPQRFLATLQLISPQIKRVFTVYSEANTGWLIRLARAEASNRGIELIAYPANDIREGVQMFGKALNQAQGPSDAIWLQLDSVLPDKTILPLALEAAWQRQLILFSSNPSHTRRGVLFALFADYRGLGQSLVELALKRLRDNSRPTVSPLDNLKISINERTASHLGLNLSGVQASGAEIANPQR